MFFYKEGHMQKLSSFGRVKKDGLKSHLLMMHRLVTQAPFQLVNPNQGVNYVCHAGLVTVANSLKPISACTISELMINPESAIKF